VRSHQAVIVLPHDLKNNKEDGGVVLTRRGDRHRLLAAGVCRGTQLADRYAPSFCKRS
jgi:hypothetical protein